MKDELDMNANLLVEFLQKPSAEFTKADIVSYIKEKNIRMVNFMYPAGDGRLKTLNFVINNAAYLDAILTCGERVDGSSLFSFIEAGSSDLYVIPRFCTAFIDPFSELPTLSMLCSFFNKDGEPLESSPEYTLHKASKAFSDVTGMQFEAMGELEYYVIADEEGLFPATDQRGYHESGPYAKFNQFRTQCMQYIAQAGGQIKYGHSEVGNFTLNGKIYEQNEIEFLPISLIRENTGRKSLLTDKLRTERHPMHLKSRTPPKRTWKRKGRSFGSRRPAFRTTSWRSCRQSSAKRSVTMPTYASATWACSPPVPS